MAAEQFEPSGFRLKPSLLRETDARSPSPGCSFACKVSVPAKHTGTVLSSSL